MRPVVDVRTLSGMSRVGTFMPLNGRWEGGCVIGPCQWADRDVNLGALVLRFAEHVEQLHPEAARHRSPYQSPEGEAESEQ